MMNDSTHGDDEEQLAFLISKAQNISLFLHQLD